jgi:hypothetical protein
VTGDRAHQRAEGVGGEHDAGGAQAAGRGLEQYTVSVLSHARDVRALEDANAVLERGAAQAPRESRRVHERTAAAREESGEVGRRVDLGAHRLPVQELDVLTVPAGDLNTLCEPLYLVRAGGHVDEAVLLPAGVDAARRERFAYGVEVLLPELQQPVHLVRPAGQPVLDPMGQ